MKKNRSLRLWAIAALAIFSLSCKKVTIETSEQVLSSTKSSAGAKILGVTAAAAIESMGTGFNLGNTFDKNQNSTDTNHIKSIIDLYYTAGMRHVRIPVTWEGGGFDSSLVKSSDGTLKTTHPRLIRLNAVVNYALKKGMYVLINTHHEHWLKDNYDGSAYYKQKFTKIWTGIANYFKSRSDKLMFEVLNEPEGNLGDWSGGIPPTNATAISRTREINKVGYDAIRATGGNNGTRIIMVSPNGQANDGQLDNVYPTKASLPGEGNDAYLAAHVHSYDPWNFCGQNGLNSNYSGKQQLIDSINATASHAALLSLPVNYGEFGVGRVTAMAYERNSWQVREYYRTMQTTMLANDMAPTVWDDRGWFALISGSGSTYSFVNHIVPHMMAESLLGKTVTLLGNNAKYVDGKSGTAPMWCNSTVIGNSEKFLIEDRGNGKVALKSSGFYVSSENGAASGMTCNSTAVSADGEFWLVYFGSNKLALMDKNGKYVTSGNGTSVMTATANSITASETFTYSKQ